MYTALWNFASSSNLDLSEMIGNDYIIGGSSHWTTDAPEDFKKRKIRVNLTRLPHGMISWHVKSWQVSIEGNIASGKSTILKKLRQHKFVEVGTILVLFVICLSCTASFFWLLQRPAHVQATDYSRR